MPDKVSFFPKNSVHEIIASRLLFKLFLNLYMRQLTQSSLGYYFTVAKVSCKMFNSRCSTSSEATPSLELPFLPKPVGVQFLLLATKIVDQ